MKKIRRLLSVLCLLLLLTGCGRYVSILPGTELPTAAQEDGTDGEDGFAARPLLTFLGRSALAESYYTDTPAALSYQRTAADGTVGCRSYVFDRASIIAACDALRAMTVTDEAEDLSVTEAEYILTMADGTEYSFTFGRLADDTRVLRTNTGRYRLDGGDGLWEISFPAYDPSFDVFDLYFDSGVRAFADRFGEDTPVTVGYRMRSGASITSTDPAAVEGVFRALQNASVIVVENRPDQNIDLNDTREYFFLMENGARYSFSFAQRCLAVTSNTAVGTVYYWLTGMDGLWGVEISSDSRTSAFEGGRAADLREDVSRAVSAAEGTYDGELSVLGVFVEYTIGEQSGYIALQDEKAAEFVRTVGAIPVAGELAVDPAGDRLTVFVTLSDNSGPILYFTGDAVQQVVGESYICDGAAMAALREQILALAADGNAADVEGSGTN